MIRETLQERIGSSRARDATNEQRRNSEWCGKTEDLGRIEMLAIGVNADRPISPTSSIIRYSRNDSYRRRVKAGSHENLTMQGGL